MTEKERAAALNLWRKHGGSQHGPRVETLTIPLENFDGFVCALRSLEETGADTKDADAEFVICGDDGCWSMNYASAVGPRMEAIAEALHYASVFSQDGPVMITEKVCRPVSIDELRAELTALNAAEDTP